MVDHDIAARSAPGRSLACPSRTPRIRVPGATFGRPAHVLLLTLATSLALPSQNGQPQLERELVQPEPALTTTATTPEREQEPAGPQLLRLRYATFDPLGDSPVVPALAGTSDLWIVQFDGLPTEDWRNAVEATGATIHSYLPDYAYVVRMPQGNVPVVQRLPFVRWLGSYAPAFRLEPRLAAALATGQALPTQRYNIVVCDKHTDKPALQGRLNAVGAEVDNLLEGSILVEATLTAAQLRRVANFDEVLWIDVWTPAEEDMDNARVQGGANYIESVAGYSGNGIRGHVYEGVEFDHPDFNTQFQTIASCNSAAAHGHCTAGIVFGNGTSAAQARGMAPDAVGFFTNYSCVSGGLSRNAVINQVVNTNECVFTTASWGSARTRAYTSISADADDVVFDHRIPWTQSQSNAGNQDSRPQAWAKNVFSIGGVAHFNNSNAADDSWASGNGSTGPAADGRIKPDLCAYYDSIWASDLTGSAGYSSGNSTTGFGGTSGATPVVAGHNALLIQMYTDGLFGNTLRVPGGTRFENRPFAQTLKALQIVGARPYAFNSSSTDNRREHQGWGFPSLQDLYDGRAAVYIVAEDDIVTQGQTAGHTIAVSGGTAQLKLCMTFVEPAGNPSASQAIVNNLDLRVTSPSGTVYWGNNGLSNGNTSTAGGSANSIDSVECVFIDNPEAGDWVAEVIAQAIVTDAHVATGATDASYALAVIGGTGTPGGSGGPGTGDPTIDATSFESGFDNWNNTGGDDLDWTRNSGSTPSSQTGPTGAQDGSTYAYVESSGQNTGYPTMTAILDGPTIAISGNEAIRFYYHMYGASMGTLQLQAVSSSGGVTTLWTRSGDQGNSWFEANVDLSSLSGQQRLRFFATTGSSWQSDFSVDNIEITGDGSIVTPPAGSPVLDADFESDFGGLSNVGGDTNDWTRQSGGTPSNSTGPSGAAEGSFYAYVESSSPNIGTNARLDSDLMTFTGNESLSFRYHMFGGSMGTLNVQAVSSSGAVTTLWTRSGDQGTAWLTANVALGLTGDYRIRFDAQLGSSWQSDICIDLVSISSGGSSGGASFAADLESGFGPLSNETGDSNDWTRQSGGTPSNSTGPSGAAQGSFYAYVESSSPNIGTNARLSTAQLTFAGNETLTFRYHMFGGSMGTLNVQAVSPSGAVTTLWTRSGDQGTAWLTASIPVSLTGSYSIRFDAQLGSSWQSDICIDDVVLQ